MAVKTMAFAQQSGQFGRRGESSAYARQVLQAFPEFTGAYFGYEPDADQDDDDFLGSSEGKRMAAALDETGRFLPYWYRDVVDGALELEPLVDMEESLYYQGVKDQYLDSGEPEYLVTEPYEYEGKLIVEEVYPIVIDGEFKGVAGVDRALDDIVSDLQAIGEGDGLDVFLVSRAGRFIAATTPDGDDLRTRPAAETPYRSVMAAGLGNRAETQLALLEDPVNLGRYYFASAPVRTGDWLVMIRLSEDVVLAPVRAAILPIGMLSLLGLGLVGTISLGIIRQTAKRIRRAVTAADQLAAGAAKQSMCLETGTADEVGQLNESFNRMIAGQAQVGEVVSAIAEGDYSRRVPLRSRNDSLAMAINEMADKREKADTELRESRERFERTVAGSGEGLWDYDPKTGRAWVSDRFARILGFEHGLEGNPLEVWLRLIHPLDVPDWLAAFQAHVDRDVPLDLELRLRDRGTEEAWVRVRGKSTRDDSGRAVRTSGSLSDITEAKAAERVLRENEARFRSLYEQTSEPFLILDSEGIRDCNTAALRLFGFDDKSKLIGTPPYGPLLTPELQPSGEASATLGSTHVEEAYTTGHSVFEWVHRRADGTEFPAEVRLSPMPALGPKAVFAIIRDRTLEKRAESDLRAARQEAESANRAKSAFLANMSHELRTPMNAIIGYSEMLLEDIEEAGQEEWQEDIQKIHDAGRHLLSLINDILDLSKIEAGRMDLYLERFELAPMVLQTADTVEPLIAQNGNTLVREVPDDIGAVRLDLTKTRQCLLNLLSNAAKFTHEGTVTLSVWRETEGADEDVVFEIRDSGIGIPADKLGSIFDEFRQADDTTTRRYGGTGLGLAISRRFCRMMGGNITVSSETGRGSIFTMRLPARVDALEAARAATGSDEPELTQAAAGGDGPVVLVIEDDHHAGELLARTLERGGFRAVVATGGEQGLELAASIRPAAITLDVMMQGLDGWAVLEAIRADSELADTPVVMVTMVSERDLGYALGADEYLTKPVDREKLVQVIRRLAAGASGPVLVVDDDPEARAMIRRQLDATGWAVAEAGDGREALQRARERTPSAVVLDLMMPVMDGFEFIREFREDEAFASVPVVVVTAKSLDTAEREMLRSQVEAVLEKGAYTREDLLDQVRQALRVRRDAAVA